MPELPEVETLMRAVKKVVGPRATLREATFFRKDLREPIDIETFRSILVDRPIRRIFRRSKYILIQTDSGFGVFHLGMTGNFIAQKDDQPVVPHTHAIFRFEKKSGKQEYLHYIDPRRFGRIAAIPGSDFASHGFFLELGPEPLEAKDLADHLFERSRRRKQSIKAFLMDPRNVVGVGNIYASESLFRVGIRPSKQAQLVTRNQMKALSQAIRQTLAEAIQAGGTTFRDFKDASGNPGYFRINLNVYDRAKLPCKKCGALIKSLRITGRSTFFCPVCQK